MFGKFGAAPWMQVAPSQLPYACPPTVAKVPTVGYRLRLVASLYSEEPRRLEGPPLTYPGKVSEGLACELNMR
eukprot:2409521-Amphidinium_carterae.1